MTQRRSLSSFTFCPLQATCTAVAVLLHYFLLAMFSWMLCEGILLYTTVTTMTVGGVRNTPKYFYAIGWGELAAVFVIVPCPSPPFTLPIIPLPFPHRRTFCSERLTETCCLPQELPPSSSQFPWAPLNSRVMARRTPAGSPTPTDSSGPS